MDDINKQLEEVNKMLENFETIGNKDFLNNLINNLINQLPEDDAKKVKNFQKQASEKDVNIDEIFSTYSKFFEEKYKK